MNPYQAYQAGKSASWTRIDMLLALYDGAVERLELAMQAYERNDATEARRLWTRAWLIVAQLAAGLNFEHGELPQNLGRLYQFCLSRIRLGTPAGLADALRILRTLREGFRGIRPGAIALERQGVIPALDSDTGLRFTA